MWLEFRLTVVYCITTWKRDRYSCEHYWMCRSNLPPTIHPTCLNQLFPVFTTQTWCLCSFVFPILLNVAFEYWFVRQRRKRIGQFSSCSFLVGMRSEPDSLNSSLIKWYKLNMYEKTVTMTRNLMLTIIYIYIYV